jgi:hypothetical protein
MKNKLFIAVSLVFCLLCGSVETYNQTQNSNPAIKLKDAPELGDKLPLKKSVKSSELLITGSGGFAPSYEVEYKGIKFTVTAGKDKRITFIDTTDINFKTTEDIAVGDSLQKVLKASPDEKLVRERGWAFFVRLKSGWNAGFVQGREMTEGELSPDAKVAFLFKR